MTAMTSAEAANRSIRLGAYRAPGYRAPVSDNRPPPPGDPLSEASAEGRGDERKSRSQKKRDAQALTDLGLQLVERGEEALAGLPLDDDLREAIAECRRLTKNARSRQLRWIGKLLRERGVEGLDARLAQLSQVQRAEAAAEQQNEHWRSRLLTGGNDALTEFVEAWPVADPKALRALIRQALRTPEGARSVRARRELLRAVRAIRAGDT